jgi:integrase/recombinase XerC
MEEAIQAFARYLKRRYPGSSTVKHYINDLRRFEACINKGPREVKQADIAQFIETELAQGRSAKTVNRRLACLHHFFAYLASAAEDDGWANPVVWQLQRVKEGQALPRDLRDSEVHQLLAAIDHPRDALMFSLMCWAGLRVGEVAALQLSDFLPATGGVPGARLRVRGKGQKERIVPLTAPLTARWEAWIRQRPVVGCEAVFVTRRGTGISVRGIQDRLAHYCRQANVPVSCHRLRHTFGRWMAEGRMPLPSLAKLLGHSQVTTTQVYIAGAGVDVRADYEAAMNRLDAECPGSPLPPAAPLDGLPCTPTGHEPDAGPGGEACAVVAAGDRELHLAAYWSDLPAWLGEPLEAYITRQQRRWKPSQLAHHSRRRLTALRRVWLWLLEQQQIDDLADLRRAHVTAYVAALVEAGVAASTINRQLRDLWSFLRFVEWEGASIAPGVFRVERLKEAKPLPRFLSEQDYHKLEAQLLQETAAGRRDDCLDRAWFYVLAHGGLRLSELRDVQLADLDLAGGRLMVRAGKGQRDRAIPLSATTVQALQAYLARRGPASTEHLFILRQRPLTASLVQGRLSRYGRAVALSVSPHCLRHTLATRLVNVGMSIVSLQRLLGHEKLTTTMIYAHVHDETVAQDFQRALARLEADRVPQPVSPEAASAFVQQLFSDPDHSESVARQFTNCV